MRFDVSPRVLLTGLWAKESKAGNTYYVGRLGQARLTILKNKDKQGEGEPDYLVFLQERTLTTAPKENDADQLGFPNRNGTILVAKRCCLFTQAVPRRLITRSLGVGRAAGGPKAQGGQRGETSPRMGEQMEAFVEQHQAHDFLFFGGAARGYPVRYPPD
jgi:hypothetical protein